MVNRWPPEPAFGVQVLVGPPKFYKDAGSPSGKALAS